MYVKRVRFDAAPDHTRASRLQSERPNHYATITSLSYKSLDTKRTHTECIYCVQKILYMQCEGRIRGPRKENQNTNGGIE